MDDRHLVIFDGVCNFCNGAAHFIIRRDPEGRFAFTPVQGELAQELLQQFGVSSPGVDTFALIKHGRCHVFADAALEITKDLQGPWFLFNVFRVVPRPIRNGLYKLLARNRYRLFGRSDACMVPSPALRSRFVGMDRQESA